MITDVTHETFDAALARVREGASTLIISTFTRTWWIDAKAVAKFAALGLDVIAKSKDGRGFLLRSGRRRDYVMPGYLKEVTT
jgi:hypothetical protein